MPSAKVRRPAPLPSLEADEVLPPEPWQSPCEAQPLLLESSTVTPHEETAKTGVAVSVAVEKRSILRNAAIAMGDASGLTSTRRNGCWYPQEDFALCRAVFQLLGTRHNHPKKMPWSIICLAVPGRKPKQCRERFVEHLDNSLSPTDVCDREAACIHGLFVKHGRKWSIICKHLNAWRSKNGFLGARSANLVKNFIIAKKNAASEVCIVRVPKTLGSKLCCETSSTPVVLPFGDLVDNLHAESIVDHFGLDDALSLCNEEEMQTMESDKSAIDETLKALSAENCSVPPSPCTDDALFPELDLLGLFAEKHILPSTHPSISPAIAADVSVLGKRCGGFYRQYHKQPRAFFVNRKFTVQAFAGDPTARRSLFKTINDTISMHGRT
jgi:hypothetical protein